MLEEYLYRLKKALNKRNVPETDDILQYFEEIINDRVEQGESLEEVLNDLGEPEQIVKAFGGKEETKEKERYDESSRHGHFVYYGIRTVKIDTQSFDFKILPSGSEETILEYDSDDDSLMHDQIGDTLGIEQDFPYGQGVGILKKMFHGSFSGGDATLHVPDGCNIIFNNVSGDVEMEGLRLNKLDLDVVSGDIEMEDVTSERMKVNTVSGDVDMDDVCVGQTLKIEAVNGDVDAGHISCKDVGINTVNGDIELGLNAYRDQVQYKVTSLFHEKTSGNSDCEYKLRIDTVNGEISYHFLAD